MSIKAGQIIHAVGQNVVDRIQTGGAGNLNIAKEKVYELGNYQSVGIVRDIPDLSFSLDCLDVSAEVEGLLCDSGLADPNADAANTVYDLSLAHPVDIMSPFKSVQGAFDVVAGVAVPHLSLESASYRYGLKQNAGEQYSLRGDSIYYVPGVPIQLVNPVVPNGSLTTFPFQVIDPAAPGTPVAVTALPYSEQGVTMFALNVSVYDPVTHTMTRMARGTDYTDTNASVVFTTAPATGTVVRIVIGVAKDLTKTYAPYTYAQNVAQGTTVKPAAIRGRDIKVYVTATGAGLPVVGSSRNALEWKGVQSVNIDWRVRLDEDFEFGSTRAVARDFIEAPDVSGTIELKAVSATELFNKLRQITGVAAATVIGPQSATSLDVWVVLLNPDQGVGGASAGATGDPLKVLKAEACRFDIPGYEGRASQKLISQLRFTSDTGGFKVVKGGAGALS
jgi:hypothetical protein